MEFMVISEGSRPELTDLDAWTGLQQHAAAAGSVDEN